MKILYLSRLAVPLLALSLAMPNIARADSYFWNTPDGAWTNTGNWSPNGTPTAADSVNINNGGTATIGTNETGAANSIIIGNTATGTLNITEGGTLSAANNIYIGDESAGNGTVIVNGTGSSLTAANDLTVGHQGSGTLDITGGATASVTSIIRIGAYSGSNGTLTVDAASGLVAGADIRIGTEDGISGGGTGSLIVRGTLSDNTAPGSGTYTKTIANFGTLTFDQDVSQTLSGVISGDGGLTKRGTGTLTLGASNTYKGATTISGGGKLVLSGTGSVAASSGVSVGSGATLDVSGITAASTGIRALSGAGAVVLGVKNLEVTDGTGSDFSGVISGTNGSFTLSGGTQTLSGNNSYTGQTRVNGGTLILSGNAGNLYGNLDVQTAGRLEATYLSGPSLSFTGAAVADIGTLDVVSSTGTTTLTLNNTAAGNGTTGVRVGSLLFAGNDQILRIQSSNNGTMALGNITVTGSRNHITGNLSSDGGGPAAPVSVSSLSFQMDNADTTSPLLNVNGQIATTTTTTTSLTAGKALTQFTAGDKVTLVQGLANSTYTTQTGVAATYGATDYLFDVDLDGLTTLAATYTGEREVNQVAARGYAYGISARSVALNNAYDNTLNIVHNWQMAAPGSLSSGSVRFNSFAQLSASRTKTKTASHVDNDGITFAAGGGWELPVADGSLLLGLFVEGGTGSYDSYNSYARGSGDTWHYGAGGFAKYRMNRGTYFEGSVRTGRTKSDLNGKGIDDYGYDSTSWYWGAHAGIGQEWTVSQSGMVDTYLKAIWTRTDSDTVTTKAKEKLHFDSVDSIRSRLGARYVHTTDAGFKAYAGAGWEYEFDGEVKSSLHGQKIHGTNELQGHSGLIEAGLEWNASKAWTMTAKVEGLTGRREGVSGMFMVNYRF